MYDVRMTLLLYVSQFDGVEVLPSLILS